MKVHRPLSHASHDARAGLAAFALLVGATTFANAAPQPAPPKVEGKWIQPDTDADAAEPVWGHADGIRIGLHPTVGPRGLIRIYAPYLDHPRLRVINFIAVEPIVAGEKWRGLSELEKSKLDGVSGLRFWSATDPANSDPQPPQRPARGIIGEEDGVETQTVFIAVEPFQNGAHVYVRVRFRADRPHEFGVSACTYPDSKPLARCVLSATMGNYARLRELHLADRVVTAESIFPNHTGDAFTDHAKFELRTLYRAEDGEAIVAATPDEADPVAATYAPGVRKHWHYQGKIATQYWRAPSPVEGLAAQVNGRSMYWASQAPIPGGVSFENFELVSPFRDGEEFWFGVEPGKVEPRQLARPTAGSSPAPAIPRETAIPR